VHVCTSVKHAKYISSYNKLYTTEAHSDLLQQVQDDCVIKISEICTEQLKVIGTKNYLYLQIRLDMSDMHYWLFQEDRFDYVSFLVILLVAHECNCV
jgi:hypothetical protein